METKLKRIETLSRDNPRMEFKWLIPHFTKENLIRCFHELGKKKAVGIDGVSKDEYGENLDENIDSLITRMKGLKYYPAPVKEVLIPKSNGKYRPLGISNIEDKIIQSMYAKILSSIYEPIFIEESYGFRPKRSCHNAVEDIHKYLSKKYDGVVIDVDLSNFFGTINHRKLIQLLEIKIKDRTFIRYIVRMLRSGILVDGELKKSNDGTPQGSIVSPVLSNIFAHYAIDIWIKEMIPKYLRGEIHVVRYADDFCICTNQTDAPRILKALEKRLERFSLKMNPDKTEVIEFSRNLQNKGVKQGTFKFLGVTIFIGRSRGGKAIVKIKTNGKVFSAKLKAITEWCKKNRNRFRLRYLWKIFQAKIRGHVQYYGVSHNYVRVKTFIYEARRIFFKWINRRSQRKSFDWEKFDKFEKSFPLPKAKIVHHLF
jgi:group II intron reverse transcriptase/maturase